MPITIRWIASSKVSVYHALDLAARGRPLVGPANDSRFGAAADRVLAALGDVAVPVDRFLAHLIPFSCGVDSNRPLIEAALVKSIGRRRGLPLVDRLLPPLAELDRAWTQVMPGVVDRLALRAEPLRSQWEARGPGLLAGLRRSLDPEITPGQADVILVEPVGGAGAAHVEYNSVRIEALLADPLAQLPEVVRLGWLISMLQLDLPRFGGSLEPAAIQTIGPLAMIPPLLAAAEYVELARCDEPTMRLAVETWLPDLPGAEIVAQTLHQWWETDREQHTEWSVSLAALHAMLK